MFRSLIGDWRLTRRVSDGGRFAGTASFREVAESMLAYREEGVLTLPSGASLRASREYFYVLEPGAIRVAFRDGTAPGDTLHLLRLDGAGPDGPLEAADVHLCGLDRYHGTYRFETDARIVVEMAVAGPEKDYRITTVLERLP